MGVGPVGANRKKAPTCVSEQAVWSAFRDPTCSYGLAAFDVDPGNRPGQTSIRGTCYTLSQPYGEFAPQETFAIHRKRSDR